jgi:hypothetical protein
VYGNVTSDGGATISERGFYFGTSTNRASNAKYIVSGTTGSFSLARTGLAENTTYYYWAYATNASGTTYGAQATKATFPTLTYSTVAYGQTYAPYNWVFTDYGRQWNEEHREIFSHTYLGNITLTTASFNNGIAAGNSGYSLPGMIGYIDQAGYNCKNTRSIDTSCDSSITWAVSEYNNLMGFIHDTPAQMSGHAKVTSASWYYWTEYGGTGNTQTTYTVANETDVALASTYVNFNGGTQYLIQYTQS